MKKRMRCSFGVHKKLAFEFHLEDETTEKLYCEERSDQIHNCVE